MSEKITAENTENANNQPSKRQKLANIVTPDVAAALDRTGTSSRSATYILSAAATSLGVNPKFYNISHSSIHRERDKFRAKRFAQIKESLTGEGPLTVHWDGKMMEDLTSIAHVDRLPKVIYFGGDKQLLSVPKLLKGSAEAQADAIIGCLNEWGVASRVNSLCFDTTASNTGRKSGTCVRLEFMLKKNLLYFACRHHVLDLVIGGAFDAALNLVSTGKSEKRQCSDLCNLMQLISMI